MTGSSVERRHCLAALGQAVRLVGERRPPICAAKTLLSVVYQTVLQDQRLLRRTRVDRMNYRIEFKPRAVKDLKALPVAQLQRVVAKIEALQQDLVGDVKKLTDFTPEYRLRVGDYRVLFEVEGNTVVVYRVLHRKDAYH